ncbi:MAG: hypothetical protein MJH10_19645 [Epibacterium sp.]|nr:hypothetical protein [Epibacterium sp.]NQX75697.1 hypothetical protein [Epibacterium sp.]
MENTKEIAAMVVVQDVLIVIMAVHILSLLRKSFGFTKMHYPFYLVPIIGLAWGAVWSYAPFLVAQRLQPPPFGQAGAILLLVLASSAFWLSPYTKRKAAQFDAAPLVWLCFWRCVFGMSVLGLGIAGGLPPEFYWSVAIGDMLVGLIGLAILTQNGQPSRRTVATWNVLGLLDLSHVLVLGAITLRPFFGMNPEVPFVNLLPMTGVPLLLSLHVLGLRYGWRSVNI